MFPPQQMNNDYIITTADYLRLWEVTETASKSGETRGNGKRVSLKHVFDSGKPNDFCSPVTSCDWNQYNVNIVGCCSIDTTVTIWDIESNQQKTKLVAHDKDVYDMAFASAETFSSCGADGSVRLFDLRSMDHSTILYESAGLTPLLRISYNQKDPHYFAVFGIESTEVVVLDDRYPSVPVSVLSGRHTGPLNGMAWSPLSARNICTVGEDAIVCIWDTDSSHSMYNFQGDSPINNVVWNNPNQENWIGVTTKEGVQLLMY
ncbi:WDcontaining protein 68 [Angomonas deanei]|nr:WDcontaining protein 68 [Angomonas deanei]|eukprot:EPY25884.1 WDcontaining protein 68 [Angomonas deanei]